jgi:hypothetical protein
MALSVVQSSSAATSHGWDRGPNPYRARRLAANAARQQQIIRAARQILAIKTLGNDERILARLARLHALYSEYDRLVTETLRIELL